jgi:hypothetical protein
VFSAARALPAQIDRSEPISRSILNAELTGQFGGTDAAGRWSVRDAHAALELAQVIFLQGRAAIALSSGPADVALLFNELDTLVPRLTVRSDEQIELQKFATPPHLA